MAKISLTRRRAVRGQIDTAIELVLFDRDPASAHVLALAASDVLRGLLIHAGKQSLHDQVEEAIRPEKMKVWLGARKGNYNFLKHADRDPEVESISFETELSNLELSAAIRDYAVMFRQMSFPMAVFNAYLVRTMPEAFVDEYKAGCAGALKLLDIHGPDPRAAAAHYMRLYLDGGLDGMAVPTGLEM